MAGNIFSFALSTDFIYLIGSCVVYKYLCTFVCIVVYIFQYLSVSIGSWMSICPLLKKIVP